MAKLSQTAFLGFRKLKLAAAKRALYEEKPGHFSKNEEFVVFYLTLVPSPSSPTQQ